MKIEMKQIKVRDLVKDFSNCQEEGVTGYGGKLNIRPPYQREFVYNEFQQRAVISTIQKSFPLNVMYWAKNDDMFEVLDGQQRTLSICGFINGEYSVKYDNTLLYFQNMTDDQKQVILDYELMIYICEGSESEKLEWFKTINIAGEKLLDQELLNAVFTGAWLVDAKKSFSKIGCKASEVSQHFLNKKVNRQELLQTALKWISDDNIEEYMAKHQHDANAYELWSYFNGLSEWVKYTFPKKRKELKSVNNWGELYKEYGDTMLEPNALEEEITELMQDDEVTKKTGIYQYVLSRDEKHLNIRAFTSAQKRQVYESQNGVCPHCGDDHHYTLEEMEADHIIPWSDGGKTNIDNCQMLCKKHNREKSNK